MPPAALRLSPSLQEGSYARLAMGPILFPDGALKLPGRLTPQAPQAVKAELQEVGHGVSVPTAILLAEPFSGRAAPAETVPHGEHTPAFAGLPLFSSAHAAETEALGGPLSRMPIEGHILFEYGKDVLTAATQAQLDRIVETLRSSHTLLEVVAYGGKRDGRAGDARRLSLRRGLAVRAYLVARGIEHRRITIRPMGGARDGGPEARVDVFHASY